MEGTGNKPPQDGEKYHAHHKYPQKFRDFFESHGIDIDAPENGTWVKSHDHLSGAKSYNDLWERQIESWKLVPGGATKQDIIDFANSLDRKW